MKSASVGLIHYIDQLFATQNHFLDARWATSVHSFETTVAELRRGQDQRDDALNKRLEGMNEIRAQLSQQAATFATREYIDAVVDRIDERIRTLQAYRANMEGRTWAIGAAFAVVNLLIAGFSLYKTGFGI